MSDATTNPYNPSSIGINDKCTPCTSGQKPGADELTSVGGDPMFSHLFATDSDGNGNKPTTGGHFGVNHPLISVEEDGDTVVVNISLIRQLIQLYNITQTDKKAVVLKTMMIRLITKLKSWDKISNNAKRLLSKFKYTNRKKGPGTTDTLTKERLINLTETVIQRWREEQKDPVTLKTLEETVGFLRTDNTINRVINSIRNQPQTPTEENTISPLQTENPNAFSNLVGVRVEQILEQRPSECNGEQRVVQSMRMKIFWYLQMLTSVIGVRRKSGLNKALFFLSSRKIDHRAKILSQ